MLCSINKKIKVEIKLIINFFFYFIHKILKVQVSLNSRKLYLSIRTRRIRWGEKIVQPDFCLHDLTAFYPFVYNFGTEILLELPGKSKKENKLRENPIPISLLKLHPELTVNSLYQSESRKSRFQNRNLVNFIKYPAIN